VHTIFASRVDFTLEHLFLHYAQIHVLRRGRDGRDSPAAVETDKRRTAMMKSLIAGITAASILTIGAMTVRAGAGQSKDIVDTAVAAGSFKTLAKALVAADLVDTLKGAGPFTVFAPTDEAFAKLPAGTLETLLKPENKAQLRRILTYHVVAGRVMAADVVKLKSAKAVSGDVVSISVMGSGVTVNSSKVVKTDIGASNGVIHVIDSVLLPASK
jgi:uncharacterized surface protein with fasciclin (FAS1) repeats